MLGVGTRPRRVASRLCPAEVGGVTRRWVTRSTGRGRWTGERSADRGPGNGRTRPAHPSLGAARLDRRARPAGGLGRLRLAQPRHRPGDRAAPRGGGARLRPHHRPGPRGLRRVPPGHRRALEREPRHLARRREGLRRGTRHHQRRALRGPRRRQLRQLRAGRGPGPVRRRRAGGHARVRGHAPAHRADGLLPGHGHVERPADPCRARPGGRPGPSGRVRRGPATRARRRSPRPSSARTRRR